MVNQKIRSASGVLAENEVGVAVKSHFIKTKHQTNCARLLMHCVHKLFHVMFVSRLFLLKLVFKSLYFVGTFKNNVV